MNEISLIESITAVEVYNGGAKAVVEKIKQEARSIYLDVTTEKGRKEIASLAYKIAKSKTYLDKLGKDLSEEWRIKTKQVNEERNYITSELDALKEEIRKPLTDFENKELARVATHKANIVKIEELALTDINATSAQIKEQINRLNAIAVNESFEEFITLAKVKKEESLKLLTEKFDSTLKRENEQKELEELRRLKAENERKEREERIASEAKEAAERAAKEREEKLKREAEQRELKLKQEAELAEKARLKAIEDAEKANILAEQKRIEAEKLAKEKAEREKQQAIEAERLRIKKEQDAIEAEKARLQKIEDAKKANEKHRNAIKKSALQSCIDAGFEKEIAVSFLKAIDDGKINNVTINY